VYNETGVQQRLESSRAGRAAISVFILVTIASVVVWNLPSSALKEEALRVTGPYVRATGLNQNWGVFSPNPRGQTGSPGARQPRAAIRSA
jgi:hypothetical protein